MKVRWFLPVVFTAYIVIVIIAGVFLEYINLSWSGRDWATNLVFAVGLAVITTILSRRQAMLQEALAQIAITEKISIIYGQIDKIEDKATPSACYQLLTETRAGFYMYQHADPRVQSELVRTTNSSLQAMKNKVHNSIYPFAFWSNEDWGQIRGAATVLKEQLLELSARDSKMNLSNTSIVQNLATIEATHSMPYQVFLNAYRDRHEGREIRILFQWEVLEQALKSGRAKICNYQFRIEDFFVGRRVYAPWHFSRTGRHVSITSRRAFRLGEIGDVNSWWHHLLPLFKERTLDIQRYLANQPKGQRPTIEVATLQISPVTYLVLDGNHRLSAAKLRRERYRNEVPVNVSEYRIIFDDPELAAMTCMDAERLASNLSRNGRS